MADSTSKADLARIGSSGLKQQGGVIDEEFHPKLKGEYGPLVYREMIDNSSTIGAIEYTISALVRQVDWRIEAASEEPEAVEAAEFIESCLDDLPNSIDDVISEALSMLGYGWSLFEIIYKLRKGETNDITTNSLYSDGKFGWQSFASRSQDSREKWEFDEEDTDKLLGMWQLTESSTEPVLIPIEKSLLFRTKNVKNNPEGRSIYRNAVINYFYLKRHEMIEAIGIERDMTGMLKMEVPASMMSPAATSSQKTLKTELETMLGQLKRDEREFILMPSETNEDGAPSGYKLSLVTSGGTRQIDINTTKEYYKTGILQSVMAQFIQLGMAATTGSWALASSLTTLFAMALGMYMDIISDVFSRDAIGRLLKINGVSPEHYPKLIHGDIETPNLSEIGAYISALASSGQLPDKNKAIQDKLLEFAGLPIPDEDDFSEEDDLDLEPEPETETDEIETPENENKVAKRKKKIKCDCGHK